MKRIMCIFMTITFIAAFLYGCGNDNSDTINKVVSEISTETAESYASENSEEGLESEEMAESEGTKEEPESEEMAESEGTKEEPESGEKAESESSGVIETISAGEDQTEELAVEVQETPAYTYTDLSKTMYAQQSVYIRDLPSMEGNKLGVFTPNQEVAVTGQCNETGWYRIDYNGAIAYVSNDYIADNQVEVAQQTVSSSSGSRGVSRNASDYRSISSLSELSAGAGWDTDYAGFCANYQNIEKVAYTYNGVTVLLYDYQWTSQWTSSDITITYTYVIFYDFTRKTMPWCRCLIDEVNSWIDNGGSEAISAGETIWDPISNYQLY